jgi:hypothetical protein
MAARSRTLPICNPNSWRVVGQAFDSCLPLDFAARVLASSTAGRNGKPATTSKNWLHAHGIVVSCVGGLQKTIDPVHPQVPQISR